MDKICVIGAGYVGLVSGTGLSEFGHNVICVDLDEEKINQLNDGIIPIYEPGLKSLVEKNYNNRLHFSIDIIKSIKDSSVVLLPLVPHRKKMVKLI